METKLEVLTHEECATKFNVSSYREQAELCAGNKVPYPTVKVYVRKKLRQPKNGQKYVFVYSKDEKNTVRYTCWVSIRFTNKYFVV